MPRGQKPEERTEEARAHRPEVSDADKKLSTFTFSSTLIEALSPWIDLSELGPDGLEQFLLAIVPLLPPPAAEPPRTERLDPEDRVVGLAQALVECAGDRARVHFQASEYFRENRLLARRVKALEAVLRTKHLTDPSSPEAPQDPAGEAAGRRYIPRAK